MENRLKIEEYVPGMEDGIDKYCGKYRIGLFRGCINCLYSNCDTKIYDKPYILTRYGDKLYVKTGDFIITNEWDNKIIWNKNDYYRFLF